MTNLELGQKIQKFVNEGLKKVNDLNSELLETGLELAFKRKEKAKMELKLKQLEAEVENQVAFDTELKNQTQREARKKALLFANEKYLLLTNKVIELDYEIKKLEIELSHIQKKISSEKRYVDGNLNLMKILGKED